MELIVCAFWIGVLAALAAVLIRWFRKRNAIPMAIILDDDPPFDQPIQQTRPNPPDEGLARMLEEFEQAVRGFRGLRS